MTNRSKSVAGVTESPCYHPMAQITYLGQTLDSQGWVKFRRLWAPHELIWAPISAEVWQPVLPPPSLRVCAICDVRLSPGPMEDWPAVSTLHHSSANEGFWSKRTHTLNDYNCSICCKPTLKYVTPVPRPNSFETSLYRQQSNIIQRDLSGLWSSRPLPIAGLWGGNGAL